MKNKFFILSTIIFSANAVSAESTAGSSLTTILVGINAALLTLVVVLLWSLIGAIQKLRNTDTGKVQLSLWDRFVALKSEKSEEELTLDEDFDGITELDNPTPPWFNFIFYTSIIVAVLYLLNYHVFKSGKLQLAEYATEVSEAKAEVDAYLKKSGNQVDENNVTLLTDKKALEEGATLFKEKCAQCHLADGGGLVGPNLTDDYWLHGGDVKSIFKTIKYGVPAKGMIAWQSTFSGKQMQVLAAYVKSLHGTKPATPKEPQGDLFTEGESATEKPDSTVAAPEKTELKK